MQRLFRPSAASPSLLRRLTQIPGAQGRQEIVLQRVKVKRKFPWKRWAAFGITGYACLQVYDGLVLHPLSQALEKAVDGLPAEAKKEELEPIFIPFPLTTKRKEPVPYSAEDPEWKEFIKLSKDAKQKRQIQIDLANMVKKNAEQVDWILRRFGKSLQLKKVWLDVDYPSIPAPEYERSGLLLDDEGLKWAPQPVDASTVTLMRRVLYPFPMMASTFAFFNTLMSQNVASVAKYLGIQISSFQDGAKSGDQPLPASHNPDIQKALQRLRQKTTQRPEEVKDPSTLAKADASDASPPPSAKQEQQQQQQQQQQQTQGQQAQKPQDADAPLQSAPATAANKQQAVDESPPEEKFYGHELVKSTIGPAPWAAFKKAMGKTWRPMLEMPPRGSVLVSGLVELEGPRGCIVIDVIAFYDTTTKKYHRKSMRMFVRRMQLRQQSPAR